MEAPISKMKKLLNMANRGTANEAMIARAKLNNLLNEYGLNENDLKDNEVKCYYFTFKNATEKQILFGIYRRLMHADTIDYWRQGSRKIGFEFTVAQYIKFKDYVEAYHKAFRQEFEAMQDRFLTAFLAKHRLFNSHENNGEDRERTLTNEDLKKIRAMMAGLDDIESPAIKIEK